MQIRTPNDWDKKFIAIHNPAPTQMVLEELQSRDTVAVIAKDGEHPIGYAYGFCRKGVLYPQYIWVDEKHRGEELVGLQLLQRLEDISPCNAVIHWFNKDMRKYYEFAGYSVPDSMLLGIKSL